MRGRIVNKRTGKREERRWCDYCRTIVPKGKDTVCLVVAVGADDDGLYEFCSERCKERFYKKRFQLPLPLPDPYSNTGVLSNQEDET